MVGTPKGHLMRVEKPLPEKSWIEARENVRVKILQQESEFYVYVESQYRVSKERSMRRRRLRRLWAGLCELRNLARGRAGGLTSEAILEKLSSIQMIDVHLPTTDGRHIVMSRYTQPEKDVSLLLAQLGLTLPEQPPPMVYVSGQVGL